MLWDSKDPWWECPPSLTRGPLTPAVTQPLPRRDVLLGTTLLSSGKSRVNNTHGQMPLCLLPLSSKFISLREIKQARKETLSFTYRVSHPPPGHTAPGRGALPEAGRLVVPCPAQLHPRTACRMHGAHCQVCFIISSLFVQQAQITFLLCTTAPAL